MNKIRLFTVAALTVLPGQGFAQKSSVAAEVAAVYAQADALYLYLHQNPELSRHETKTAARMAAELRALGYEVTENVGGGVVGVLRNGTGPTVLLRTDMDALPVTEATGLPYASTVRTRDDGGNEVGVAHACGHDVHMSAWISTARIMASTKTKWRGTLVMMGQPAEEIGAGAKAMIADGLLTRFPRPDYALAIHDDARTPAGVVTYRAGPVMSNTDNVFITIYGRGGHGARPEATVDPIVIAARTVVALQTIIAREISPFDQAVITVGTFHGGTKNNVIPDEVKLGVTVRSFTPTVREQLHAAIRRIVIAEAAAGNAPREPLIERGEVGMALVNDSALTFRVRDALVAELGAGRVLEGQAEMVGEDFSEFPRNGIPTVLLRIGAVEKLKYDDAIKNGKPLPSLHSSLFAPDREPTIKAATEAEVVALRALLRPR